MKTIEFNNVYGELQSHNIFEDEVEFKMFYGGNPPPLVKDWKQGLTDDWVMADDGKICQVLLRKGELKHPGDNEGGYSYHSGYLRTAVMATPINNNPNTTLHCDDSIINSRYKFGKSAVTDQRTRIIGRKFLTKSERVFIFNLLHRGLSLEDSYLDAYPSNKSSGTKVLKRALLLIKQERIVSEIKKEVEDAAGKLGITHESVLAKTLGFADSNEVDPRVALEATKMLGKAIGTFEPKKIEQHRLTGGYGETIIELTDKDNNLIDDAGQEGITLPESK